jgi:hypothetical protein
MYMLTAPRFFRMTATWKFMYNSRPFEGVSGVKLKYIYNKVGILANIHGAAPNAAIDKLNFFVADF